MSTDKNENKAEIAARLQVANSTTALGALSMVIEAWVLPFMEEWRLRGSQPAPSPGDVKQIIARVDQLEADGVNLPDGYAWLPELLRHLSASIRFNSRNFVNIHPNPFVPSIVASTLVALQNPNNIVPAVSKATTRLEEDSVAWMAEHLVGFDPECATGNMVSGGTIANITALLVARDYCYRKLARPRPAAVRERGLCGKPDGVILATAGSHYSVKKAAWILGLGDESVVRVPVGFDEDAYDRVGRDERFLGGIRDSFWSDLLAESCAEDKQRGEEELVRFYQGEDEAFSLQPLDSEINKALYGCFEYNTPLIGYVFTIGTTDTGTIERPDRDALRLLQKEDVFVHADAAAGGFALLHSRVREQVKGLKHVHSVTVDGHKLGHLPYPNGTILFRDRSWVSEIMQEAPYLKGLAPTIEGSRPGTHVASLWAAIQDLARGGLYERWLERLFCFVDRLLEAFRASTCFQVLHKVDLTTIAVAPLPRDGETRREMNRLARRVSEAVERDSSEGAFLVNFDRELAGIKVCDRNEFRGGGSTNDENSLTDIQCLRIVATNPEVDAADAPRLVEYLEKMLSEARGR